MGSVGGLRLLAALVAQDDRREEFFIPMGGAQAHGHSAKGKYPARKAVVYILLACGLMLLSGCREDMQNQPYYRPLRENDFYADRRSARPLVAGTVARGHLDADSYFYTGKIGSNDGDFMPFPVTDEVMARGQQRFDIYCTPCHSEVGDGNGMIVQRGFKHPPSYHTERLRKAPIGYFFDVMTNGYGAMPDYAQQVAPQDRWAIAAYIRALQLSQHASESDVPSDEQVAKQPPAGVMVSPPYDTQGAAATKSNSAPANGGQAKP